MSGVLGSPQTPPLEIWDFWTLFGFTGRLRDPPQPHGCRVVDMSEWDSIPGFQDTLGEKRVGWFDEVKTASLADEVIR